jgi:LPXTG-motif cell wall-anchored protein
VNRSFKRLLALAGSATVGVLAAVAVATPAQAHHPEVSGEANCVDATGKYEIEWTVENGNWSNRKMKVIQIVQTPADSSVSGLTVGEFLDAGASKKVMQTNVAGNVVKSSVKLAIEGEWFEANGNTTNVGKHWNPTWAVTWPTGTCTPPPPAPDPTATFRADCDGTISVHIVNTHTAAVDVTVTGIDGAVNVPAGGSKDVTVPAGTAGPILVKKGDKTLAESPGWTRPADCAKPTSIGESTCTTFKVSVTNSEKGQSTEATVTYGTQVKKVTVAPGKTEVVELTPGSQTEAVVSYSGWANYTEKVKYEKPADCPGLPQTGANTMTYIGSGIGLAVVGFFAIYFGRRRLARLRRMAA